MRTVRAPRSSTHSSSSIAFSTIGQGDDRRREDAVLVVERPGLVHPLVERVDHGVDELRVVAHPLLEQAGERREHEGPVDAELVHQLDAGAWLAERGDALHRLADDLAVGLALRVADAEVLLLRARAGHDLERRVRDVLADLAPDHDLRAAPHLDVVDRALVPIGEMAGERILGLVEVVVGVEHREVAHARHALSLAIIGLRPTSEVMGQPSYEAAAPRRTISPRRDSEERSAAALCVVAAQRTRASIVAACSSDASSSTSTSAGRSRRSRP